MTLKSYLRKPASGKNPTSVVVLLHGLGANGQDLIGLADEWTATLPDTVFVSPDAPFPCDMAPYGRQWFSLQSWSPLDILRGVETAAPILNDFLDDVLKEYGLTDDRLALAGFSQGTMMSLYTAPRREKKIAGVLGYSGAVIGAETLTFPGIHRVPVHLIHGDSDGVVVPAMYHASRAALMGAGFTVTGGLTRGLAHSIDMDGIKSGAAFLQEILKA